MNGTDDNPLGRIITMEENSLLASINIFGAFVGSIIYGILASCYGRKTLLIAMSIPTIITNLILAWAKQIWVFLMCRFIGGTGLGGAYALLPVYCGEIADVSNRGILGTSMSVFICLGMMIPYVIGPNLPFFWVQIILATLPAIYVLVFIFFSPETPQYLIKKHVDKAVYVLQRLRGREDVSDFLREMLEDTANSPNINFLEIVKSRSARNSFFIGLGLYTFMQLTGNCIVLSYSQRIFEIAKSKLPPKIPPVILSMSQLITTIIVSSIADRFPRKTLLTISFSGVAITLIPFGTYFYLYYKGSNVTSFSWLPLVCLVVFVSMFNCGVGPVIMAISGEIFPPKLKGLEISILTSYNWVLFFLITYSFNRMDKLIGIGCLFWIFSGCCCVALLFVKFFVLETKGKTLHEIQEELNK